MEENKEITAELIYETIYVELVNSTYVAADHETIVTGARTQNLARFLSNRIAAIYSESPIKKKNMQLSEAEPSLNTPSPILSNTVGIKLDKGAMVPLYETERSAGFDLVANFVNEPDYTKYAGKFKKELNKDYFILADDLTPEEYNVVIMPGCVAPIPTGIYMEIPIGNELQVRPRSGIASKQLLTVINSPGTIDSDYRGEIVVLLFNASKFPQTINQGMRVAQAVLSPINTANFIVINTANFIVKEELSITVRGEGGFGSTGTNIKM